MKGKPMLRRAGVLLMVMTAFSVTGRTATASHDSLAGERYFKRCAPCHSLTDDIHKAGPSLKDVVGRRAGTAKGFHYSKDLKAAGKKGLIWDHKNIHDFLGDPRGFLATFLGQPRSKTKMKLRYPDHDFREKVIDHLERNGNRR